MGQLLYGPSCLWTRCKFRGGISRFFILTENNILNFYSRSMLWDTSNLMSVVGVTFLPMGLIIVFT